MIICLYGRDYAPFVEPVARDLQSATAMLGGHLEVVTIETVIASGRRCNEAARVYVLPFDVPPQLPQDLPSTPAPLVRALFPNAEIVNSIAVHDLCWDKIDTARHLLARGVPIPDTLITQDPLDARGFILAHEHAVLKEPRSCAGHGHLVVFPDGEGNIVGEARGRRYLVLLEPAGTLRRVSDGLFHWPAPFYLQRLVAAVGRRGKLSPAQVLRAYIVDGEVMFWTERYRPRCRQPSDFIISVALGARYRFLPSASEEASKIARRAAEVLDMRIGVVDLIRTGSNGPFVLELDTDGPRMFIDRQFKQIPDFRPHYDFDYYIAEALLRPATQAVRQRLP
jgi:glutathione synthase/RimK-type ligase-like ATP-grasp enzyme